MPTWRPKNSRGATPTTVAGTPLTTMALPTIAGSACNRLVQYRPADHGAGRSSPSPADRPVPSMTAAEGRPHAERGEEVARDVLAVDRLRLESFPGYLKAGAGDRQKVRERLVVIAKVLVVPPREGAHARLSGISAQQLDELFRVAHRQRAEHQRVDQAEDRRVGADAERERQNRHRGEARRATQRPRGISHVLPRGFDDVLPADVTHMVFDRGSAAQLHPRGARGRLAAHARAHLVLDRHVEELLQARRPVPVPAASGASSPTNPPAKRWRARHQSSPSDADMIRAIAAVCCSQSLVSRLSVARPCAVSA